MVEVPDVQQGRSSPGDGPLGSGDFGDTTRHNGDTHHSNAPTTGAW